MVGVEGKGEGEWVDFRGGVGGEGPRRYFASVLFHTDSGRAPISSNKAAVVHSEGGWGRDGARGVGQWRKAVCGTADGGDKTLDCPFRTTTCLDCNELFRIGEHTQTCV